jgi:hypothetical protein
LRPRTLKAIANENEWDHEEGSGAFATMADLFGDTGWLMEGYNADGTLDFVTTSPIPIDKRMSWAGVSATVTGGELPAGLDPSASAGFGAFVGCF